MKIITESKVNAYALIYVLLITLMVSLLCSYLLLAIFQYKQIHLKTEEKTKLIRNNQNLLKILKSKHCNFENDLDALNDLSFEENVTSSVRHSKWGLYDLVKITSKNARDTLNQYALMGVENYPLQNVCLYLSDNNVPLSLSGNALLKGDAYLPSSGIRSAVVNGQSYQRDGYVFGNLYKSSAELPGIDHAFMDYYLNYKFLTDFNQIELKDSISRSFALEPVLLDLSEMDYRLNYTLKGNIIAYSEDSLYISNTCKLEDIIIVAPYIELQSNCKLSAQFIAYSGIHISKNCKLKFPSALYMDRADKEYAQIIIDENCRIEGAVYALQTFKKSINPILSISEGSKIKGLVYASGITEIQGGIEGSLISENLQFKFKGSLYRSYLVDVSLDNSKLEDYFSVPDMYFETNKKSVVKWLD
ncbi:MAG: hypothetical protein RH860_01830 [Cytophagales bacterium]